MRSGSLYFFFGAFICSLSLNHAVELPRGVHPANSPFYNPLEPFTCLDKSATLPWRKVNDDYCDCLDGSDEPGTSACPFMNFYCANAGHEGTFVYSNFVNDGFCDCCDGSDEYTGIIQCANTCDELAVKKESEVSQRRKEFEEGHEIYKSYVQKKAVELEDLAKREAEEAEERTRLTEELNKAKELDDSTTLPPPPPETTTIAPQTQETIPEPIGDEEIDDAPLDEGHPDQASDEIVPEEEHLNDDLGVNADGVGMEEVPVDSSPPPPPVRVDYGPDNGYMMLTEPSTGCLEIEHKEYVYSLCAFKEVRQRQRNLNSGGTLLGNWGRWSDHPDSSIEWSKEEKLAKLPYKEMIYDGGEHCWNGPTRSARVKIFCGATNKLLFVDEPSRCTYLIKMQTPAACHHDIDHLLEMHTEL